MNMKYMKLLINALILFVTIGAFGQNELRIGENWGNFHELGVPITQGDVQNFEFYYLDLNDDFIDDIGIGYIDSDGPNAHGYLTSLKTVNGSAVSVSLYDSMYCGNKYVYRYYATKFEQAALVQMDTLNFSEPWFNVNLVSSTGFDGGCISQYAPWDDGMFHFFFVKLGDNKGWAWVKVKVSGWVHFEVVSFSSTSPITGDKYLEEQESDVMVATNSPGGLTSLSLLSKRNLESLTLFNSQGKLMTTAYQIGRLSLELKSPLLPGVYFTKYTIEGSGMLRMSKFLVH